MRILFTADWQSDFENLDLCEKAAKEVIGICNDRGVDGLVIAGDLKRQYNPIDTRVVQFWMDFIHTVDNRTAVQGVYINLGNHDRVGMYSEAQNWLPILQRAGAKVVHNSPMTYLVRGTRLHFLPFSSSVEQTRSWANALVKDTDYKSLLVFHADLQDCSYNALGHKSAARLKVSDLHPERYTFCFGGHVHLRQKLGKNVYYIGNPFCTDWGEANQQKGYMLYDSADGGGVHTINSKIPCWYDPSWPRFPKERTEWKGARIRIHVPIEVGESYAARLDAAKQEAENKYAGSTVYAVPEFKEAQAAEVKIKLSDPDAVKIRAYVDETLPDSLARHHDAIISYLLYKLNHASEGLGLRSGGRITFLSAYGRRFLSFRELEVDYREPGLRLVVGKNKDWLGRSNGSGKTNFQSPIPVALFGTTFKGQKHDEWALRGTKKPAYISVYFKDAKGRKIKVVRGRHPSKLQLFVDGKDQSSGLQSTSKTGTQGLIERLSGLTWQTLANAVYIDQQQVNTFLSTPSEQKKILERFQNLERFTKALEFIRSDIHLKKEALGESASEKDIAEAEVKGLQHALGEKAEPIELEECKKKLQLARESLETVKQQRSYAEFRIGKKIRKLERIAEKLKQERSATLESLVDLRKKDAVLENKVEASAQLYGKAECPTCLQPVNVKHLQGHISKWNLERACILVKIKRLEESGMELLKARGGIEDRVEKLESVGIEWKEEEDKADQTLRICIRLKNSAVRYWNTERKERKGLEARIRNRMRSIKFWVKQIKILTEEQAILDYCQKAFSRDGVPAFLNAQMCRPLNQAAEEYSEAFTAKEIQVRFKMQDGEFEVEVVNAHGGEGIKDQSAGEKKMAAIIASFALRSVAPPCNLLVLDEPGDGLDPANAKAFAAGLRKLKDRMGTILLTTHNPIIAGELSGETRVVVQKEGGVSTCMPSN